MTEENTNELSGAEQLPPEHNPPESSSLPEQSAELPESTAVLEAPHEEPVHEAVAAPVEAAPVEAAPVEAAPVADLAEPAESTAAPVAAEAPEASSVAETADSEAAPPSAEAAVPAPAATGSPARPPRQEQRGPRPPRSQDARGPKSEGKTGQANPRNNAKRSDQMAYKPEHVLQRLQGRPGVFRAYVHEAESLLYQIRLVGLGPSLAVLLSQTEHKSKRRIYWDISKWIFKEQRIKGKNVRSLMESIVYGDPRFLLKATHSVVNFLEELVHLSQEPAYQPHARSDQS